MNNVNGLQTAPDLHDKDETIFQALMTAIVEHQLLPGSKLPEEALAEAIDGNTILVSVMLVNNETGAIFPVEAAAR